MTLQAIFNSKSILKRTDLIELTRTGIPTKSIGRIKEYTSLTDSELSNLLPISQRQLLRYPPTHKLNKEITSHLIQFIELFQKGFSLFGEKKFKLWIRTPNTVLNKNRPIDILDTSIGIEMVEDVLGRIQHGVYS